MWVCFQYYHSFSDSIQPYSLVLSMGQCCSSLFDNYRVSFLTLRKEVCIISSFNRGDVCFSILDCPTHARAESVDIFDLILERGKMRSTNLYHPSLLQCTVSFFGLTVVVVS